MLYNIIIHLLYDITLGSFFDMKNELECSKYQNQIEKKTREPDPNLSRKLNKTI